MSRLSFSALYTQIDCEDFHIIYSGGNEQVPGEKQLMMALWWLGKGENFISIGDKFNVAVSTVFECTGRVISKILEIQNKYIVWPDATEIYQVEYDFRTRSGYPGVISAIDVCYIAFKAPLMHQNDYIDRKMHQSIKLQAITPANKIFTNISVGFPSSAHDGFSKFWSFFEVEENENYRQYFPDETYHIVGDSAYPLLNWIMTPYRDNGRLNDIERNHNIQHSRTRIVVEHTFGILKSRWRILNYINVNSVTKAVKIIAACCILHNFCYINSDFWDTYEAVINDPDENDIDAIRNVDGRSIRKRNEIAYSL